MDNIAKQEVDVIRFKLPEDPIFDMGLIWKHETIADLEIAQPKFASDLESILANYERGGWADTEADDQRINNRSLEGPNSLEGIRVFAQWRLSDKDRIYYGLDQGHTFVHIETTIWPELNADPNKTIIAFRKDWTEEIKNQTLTFGEVCNSIGQSGPSDEEE